jgi:preprotein translocase subunit SecE
LRENGRIFSENFQKWDEKVNEKTIKENYSRMKKIVNYFKETYDELANKVTWPSAKDLQSSVVVVSIASLIIALVVCLMDWIFNLGMTAMFPMPKL